MHLRRALTRALLVALALSALACREQSGTQAAADPPTAAEPKPSVKAPSAQAAPPASETSVPPNAGLPAQPERVDHVTIDPRPRCGPALDETESYNWLKPPDIQRSVSVLNGVLKDFERASIGSTLDNQHHAIIVVFHSDFHDYDRVRQRLVGRIAPLQVVLQPSCHSRAQLAEVEQALLEGSWHPKAKDTPRGSWLDPSFSGYRVTIDDSAPEVAEALKKRFGDLVRVSLGKPRRT